MEAQIPKASVRTWQTGALPDSEQPHPSCSHGGGGPAAPRLGMSVDQMGRKAGPALSSATALGGECSHSGSLRRCTKHSGEMPCYCK